VVVLIAAAAAGVAFAIFAVKRWLYANGGLSEGLRGAAHRAREDFEQSQASPASRTESGESVLRLKKLAREAQAEDAVEIDPKEPR